MAAEWKGKDVTGKTLRIMLLGEHALDPGAFRRHESWLKKFRGDVDYCVATPRPAPAHVDRRGESTTEQVPRTQLSTPIEILSELRVSAVNLATPHWAAISPTNMRSALRLFDTAGVDVFGGGPKNGTSQWPFRLRLPQDFGGGDLLFYGQSLASPPSASVSAPESMEGISASFSTNSAIAPADNGEPAMPSFKVALPHWGDTSGWRSFRQYRDAYRLLRNGYDLVVGQGSESIQEIERQNQRWVVYGLGTSVRTSDPAASTQSVFSLCPILEVQQTKNGLNTLKLKLYPIAISHADANSVGPVEYGAFRKIVAQQADQATTGWRFDNPDRTSGQDHFGYYIELRLGAWAPGQSPQPIAPLAGQSDPGVWTPQRTPVEIENSFLNLNKISMGASMFALQAEENGGSADWISSRQALITVGKKKFIAYGYVSYESALGVSICSDKVLTARFLTEAGVQTPVTQLVSSEDEAADVAEGLPGPVVVKPSDGKKSRGVTTNLVGRDAVKDAFRVARQHGSQVIVQQHVDADEEIRVMASSKGAFAVLKRVLPHVVGDGVTTIRQLIYDKNLQRELNPSMRSRSIPTDAATENQLRRLDYTLESVPPTGETVIVRNVAGLSAGADPYQAFEVTELKVKELAAGAVAAIPGLGWGGVDVIIEKGTGEPYVLEINTDAGYGQAMFPTYGEPINVAETAWKLRIDETKEAPTAQPATPRLVPKRQPVIQERQPSGEIYSRVHLVTLFRRFMDRSELIVDELSPAILRVTSPSGRSVFMTNAMLTSDDRSAAVRVLRHHGMVRQLLRLHDVPRAKGRIVTSSAKLGEYLESFTGDVALIPSRTPWAGRDARFMDGGRASRFPDIRSRTFVQKRPSGLRLTVLSTPQRALTIVARGSETITKDALRTAAQLAVRAVRAVPELRWASTDVVITPRGSGVVEGMNLNPRFTSADDVVGGSLYDFFSSVIEV